jgi:type I restriction enzyme M protein
LSFVHAQGIKVSWQPSGAKIYGVDPEENVIMLATLNMLLNGDVEALGVQREIGD